MTNIINITEPEWFEKYRPVASEPSEFRYVWYADGDEEEYVKDRPANKIWTLMDSDDSDDLYIVNGFHMVNRVGHYITEEPFEDNVIIQVFFK